MNMTIELSFLLFFFQNGGAGGLLGPFLPLILIFGIFYLLLIRPQQTRMKQQRAMIDATKKGDTVVTGGGLIGKVTKVIDDNQIEIEVSDDVRVRQMRSMVADVRAKGEPVQEEGASS